MNFDIYLTYFEKILQKKWPLKYIDIDLSKTLLYNKYEGLRIGSGFYTNEAVSKKITLGGFMGYGVKDEQLKYGGEFVVHISKKNEFDLGVSYQNDLMETGGYGKGLNRKLFFDYRKFIGYQYDHIKQLGLSAHFRCFDYFLWDIRLNQTETDPKYIYEFKDGGKSYTRYKNGSLELNLRFAYKEKFINSFNQNISTGTKYPILYLSYTRGVKNLLGGNFDYNKTELALEHSFYVKSLGNTSYRLEGGYIDKTLPYGLLFTGEGSYDKGVPFIMENTFQTMAPYEFLSNRYVNLFWSHNFGGLLFKQQKFQPILSWHNNMGWGALSHVESHQFIEFKTKNKLFLETGLQLDNLIKLNYMNLADIGFGAGCYYRYGYYTNQEFKDNVAFKFTLNFSIK